MTRSLIQAISLLLLLALCIVPTGTYARRHHHRGGGAHLHRSFRSSKYSVSLLHESFTLDHKLPEPPASLLARFPRPLSPKAMTVYKHALLAAARNPDQTPTPSTLMAGSGKIGKRVLDYGEGDTHCRELWHPVILKAQREVLLTTYYYNHTCPCVEALHQALRDLDQKLEVEKGASSPMVNVNFVISTLAMMHFNPWTDSRIRPRVRNIMISLREISPPVFKLPDPSQFRHLRFRVKTFHQWPFGTLHSKMLVVDGREAVLGSKNMDADVGQEYAYSLTGNIVDSLRADFADLWDEPLRPLDESIGETGMVQSGQLIPVNGSAPVGINPVVNATDTYDDTDDTDDSSDDDDDDDEAESQTSSNSYGTSKGLQKSKTIPMIALPRKQDRKIKAHRLDNPQNTGWLAAMAVAERDAFIQTPDFLAHESSRMVRQALERGVNVTVITSFQMMDQYETLYPYSDGHNRAAAAKLFNEIQGSAPGRGNLRICWFIGRRVQPPRPLPEEWSHVKAMIIDDTFAIVGSGNMDPQSWFHSRENNFLWDDVEETVRFKRELLASQQSLEYCTHDAEWTATSTFNHL
ncbi:hypothetical protein BJ684DRAFT_14304 [Piptocephalis cylindrospora]|uniref:PLD phosphodiesterase domain-containing protein n=1 Tax=Piptocephalis cylindrospora TaxID=1907219 RepID=A0A4P9Y8T3_9FUNG|nr:hypothetical protein BJ684DRAFT_14304 [Piptocephalis cylindrospora]|eukprot:RKP15445.1 hypothetical protein BJ684DRAFT_14304 [Piptocephalis cylindrospora]